LAVNSNEKHEQSLSQMERVAMWVTEHVGTFGFFLIILTWTAIWLVWNLVAPLVFRFDPAPGFITWLFISNLIQIMLMPLIMVGQNLQARHAEFRSEAAFETTQLIEREVEDLRARLIRMEALLQEAVKARHDADGQTSAH
jgi:uncharacterized membrane protein